MFFTHRSAPISRQTAPLARPPPETSPRPTVAPRPQVSLFYHGRGREHRISARRLFARMGMRSDGRGVRLSMFGFRALELKRYQRKDRRPAHHSTVHWKRVSRAAVFVFFRRSAQSGFIFTLSTGRKDSDLTLQAAIRYENSTVNAKTHESTNLFTHGEHHQCNTGFVHTVMT